LSTSDCCQERHSSSVLNPTDFSRRQTILLTDDLLLFYKRCQRRAFLDTYGDFSAQDPESDFLRKLRQDSRAHQEAVLANIPHQSPNYPRKDWEAGAKATLELMQQGIENISQGILLMDHPQGVILLSRPDLLVKQPGESIFGDWMYVPTNIKLGKRPKPEYQMVVTFSAKLLAAVQGIWPRKAWLILRRQISYSVNLAQSLPLMQKLLSECIKTLRYQQEPEVFISRQKCNLCQWYSSCYATAQQQQHISLLPGITPSRYQNLKDLGITTLKSLANSTISPLKPVLGDEIAADLVRQAQSTVENRVIFRQKDLTKADNSNSFIFTNALLPQPVELYFDIEAEPTLEIDYLLGVLVIDKYAQSSTFYPFLAENPSDELSVWQQFLELVYLYPQAPIFHFSDYEVETVKRLAKLYQTPTEQIQLLLSRFVDMHQQVMNSVTLPVESYSLKHLARWLGFEWRDPGITGSQSVCLYDQWLQTGDRSLLDLILRYNEDDCRATHHLKNWLTEIYLENRLARDGE